MADSGLLFGINGGGTRCRARRDGEAEAAIPVAPKVIGRGTRRK